MAYKLNETSSQPVSISEYSKVMLCTTKKWAVFGVVLLTLVGVSVNAAAPRTNGGLYTFPDKFRFGTASAAYQIEGASDVDGKGPNVWDDFVKIAGKIEDGSNGDQGPDSYYHYREDVRLMKEAHMNFYRFSISWARVLPDGDISSVNEAGLQYYDNLINALLEDGIEPVVTMYHWDLPSRLQDLGGFTSPLFPRYFEQYAILLYSRYGDRVKQWITFNEPGEFCPRAYGSAEWAPGIKVAGGEYYCVHHMLLAHAKAYHVYNDRFRATQKGRVGITLYSLYNFPKDATKAADVEAAERAQQFQLGLYAHPIFIGDYPEVVKTSVDGFSADEGRAWSRLPVMDRQTIDFIKGTTDFLGLNYYTSRLVENATNPDKSPMVYSDARIQSSIDVTWPRAKSVWLYSVPEGLKNLLMWIKDNYNNVEVMITENGWSDDGELEDDNRIEYLRLHLRAILEAIEQGCNVTGHTTWSILDNFEWAKGFTEKFGIHGFNRTTKLRSVKKSVSFLRDVITSRTLPKKVPTDVFP